MSGSDDGHPRDTYLLPDDPGTGIEVLWAASGGVLMASSLRGGELVSHLYRSDHPVAKVECILRALAQRTNEFPALPTDDSEIIFRSAPRLLLKTAPVLPMRWYARPEGYGLELRVAPRLASWEKAEHPDQARLQAYLDDTEALLAESRIGGPWALRFDVGLPPERDLLNMGDLDNYAYPLADRLKDSGLVSVWCTKQLNEASFVQIEPARDAVPPATDVLIARTTESSSSRAFKEQVYTAVVHKPELPAGPVRLELSFVVGPGRNWLNLWKQTIDSLDPLLGRTHPYKSDWHPLDGRIVELGLHVSLDASLRHDVQVGIAASTA
ncbi:hypothetical protein [Mycolicibacterium arenosum]|uniref:Rv3651-like N-terminal domain-containing protein n=1 Tax=Mycolicibacterium arenosum TaxID=2952157 RepID=A0ABT1M879_9MYCO|nr:hypothetical protein [Mycolicibacterium sp. CAU 1645]MCP9274002.1 hypothetical protein [Mycolicibacterium sp. CAU 1645]